MTFFIKEARLLTRTRRNALRTPVGANAGRRAPVTLIASLIESSDFFWDVRESRADYGVPIAEFFCGVIFKATASLFCGMPLARKPYISVHEVIRRHNTFSKRFNGIIAFPTLYPTVPLNPAAPPHFKAR